MDNGSIQANANIDTAADMDFPSAPNEQSGLLDVGLSLKSFILDGHFKTDLQDSVSHLGTVNFAGLSSLEAIAKLVTLINSIPVPSKLAGGLIIPFGSVTLVDNDPMTSDDFNLFDMHAFDSIKQRNSTLTGRLGQAISAFNTGGFADALSHSLDANGNPITPDPDVSSFATGLGNKSIADFIDFPVLNDPSQIIGALSGGRSRWSCWISPPSPSDSATVSFSQS